MYSGRTRLMARPPGGDELELGLADVSLVGDISADGETVAFAEFGDVDTASGAYLRPTRGGAAHRLGEGIPLDLADDGRGVLAFLWGEPRSLAVFPVTEGPPRKLPLFGLAELRWARWCAGDRIVVGAAAPGRPRRVWRFDPDGRLEPITEEGVFGACAVSPDGRQVALSAGDRLLVVGVDGGPPREVPGSFAEQTICGWGDELLVRGLSPPLAVRRVHPTTGAATKLFEIAPPPLGRRGVYAVAVSRDAGAYAYSYSQELSRLYTMTTEELAG